MRRSNIADCFTFTDFGNQERNGNCYDNAKAENFFSRFKAELVEGGIFESVEQARSETSVTLKVIIIASGGIQVWAIKAHWNSKEKFRQ